MARIRTIGKKEAPVAKRHTIGQKIVDNRYVQAAAMAAATGVASSVYQGVVEPSVQSAMAPGLASAGVASIGAAPVVPRPDPYRYTRLGHTG